MKHVIYFSQGKKLEESQGEFYKLKPNFYNV